MPGDLLSPSIAVVVLGLGSSVSWGTSDFFGGLLARRAPLLGVMVITQAIGVALALPLFALHGELAPAGADVSWSLVSGLLGVVGLGCLYQGLAVGRMGVVAPVAGLLVAGIPVVYGLATQGVLPLAVLAGIALAMGSVVLISRVPPDAADRPSGLAWGLGAGLTLGALTIAVAQISGGHVFGPLVVIRTTEALVGAVVIVLTRRGWRVPRELWPAAFAVGLFDMAGTAAYLAAIQIGPLAVAAVLSALYPAMTVLLAAALLRERLTAINAVGLGVAALAVILIAGGQAG
jgi:drug/metabolite transporter (DMT)-like permease